MKKQVDYKELFNLNLISKDNSLNKLLNILIKIVSLSTSTFTLLATTTSTAFVSPHKQQKETIKYKLFIKLNFQHSLLFVEEQIH